MQYEKENVKGSVKWKKINTASRRMILSQKRTFKNRQSVAFHDAMEYVAQSSRLQLAFAVLIFPVESASRVIRAYVCSFKRNSRAHGRSCVTVQGHARSRGAYPQRDVASQNRHLENAQLGIWWDVFTWDKLESSRILASMVTWLAWILATASAAANRNASIVLRSGCSSLGIGTRENFTNHSRITFTTRTIPDDLCRIIDHR